MGPRVCALSTFAPAVRLFKGAVHAATRRGLTLTLAPTFGGALRLGFLKGLESRFTLCGGLDEPMGSINP